MAAITSSASQAQPVARARCTPLLGIIATVIVIWLVAFAVTLTHQEHAAATPFDTAVTSVEGVVLPRLADAVRDPAIGAIAPQLDGTDRDGNALVAPAKGRATVLLFLAHWCPYCQASIPVVQGWLEDGNLPADVDLVGVAAASESDRPNYPASAWLDQENWTIPTISDASSVAATAYGAPGFPYWVAIDGTGAVVERRMGELSPRQITQLTRVAQS